jgi:hypothetical protein
MPMERLDNSANFSLMLGGPLYQAWRRTRLVGEELQLLRRRVVVLTVVAWLPLLLLSTAEGTAWGPSVTLPFLKDIELHARLLLALPLLVVAELIVHQRMRGVVFQFVERGIVVESTRPRFDAAVESAMRLRNAIWAEVLLIAMVYVIGVGFVWRTQTALTVAGWHGAPINGHWQMSIAGWWLVCVSLPLFQFLLLRWYFRMFIWARFLWKVSRIDLVIIPTHPDLCGGLGFLAALARMFSVLLLAQGVVLAGLLASRIFFAGAKLPEFELELIGLVALMLLAVLGPLLVFSPKLAAAKRQGLREYGGLAQRYVREYDRKWLRGGVPPGESFIGSGDIQSLADLGNSFETLNKMRMVPFTTRTILHLAVITLAPVLPLLLTMIPLEQLLERLLKIVF